MKRYLVTFAALLIAVAQTCFAAGVDFRPYQSPVRNQNSRGNCSAFAVTGTLETMPGIPSELSVQYLYSMMKKTELGQELVDQSRASSRVHPYAASTDWLERYIGVLQEYGVPAEQILPYIGSPQNSDAYCRINGVQVNSNPLLTFLCSGAVDSDTLLRA